MVSKGFGLPTWKKLVARVLDKEEEGSFLASLDAMGHTAMSRLIDPLDDASVKYHKTVLAFTL